MAGCLCGGAQVLSVVLLLRDAAHEDTILRHCGLPSREVSGTIDEGLVPETRYANAAVLIFESG